MTKAELIAALERAEGPTHRLDHEIAKLVFGDHLATARYTASIDAALTLVPDKLLWAIYSRSFYCMAQAQIEDEQDLGNIIGDGLGTNPAIALCIAALKVRNS